MIAAIDSSLQSSGLAVLGPAQAEPYWAVRTIRSNAPVAPRDPALAELRRMEKITHQLRRSIQEMSYGTHLDLMVMEAPAFSKNVGMAHERAGLWWMLYQMLAGHGRPVMVVKPNLRAKYATGKGTAGKDEVLLAASRRYPGVPMTNNNEADAVVLAAMGARYLGVPVDQLPQANLAAMMTLTAV